MADSTSHNGSGHGVEVHGSDEKPSIVKPSCRPTQETKPPSDVDERDYADNAKEWATKICNQAWNSLSPDARFWIFFAGWLAIASLILFAATFFILNNVFGH